LTGLRFEPISSEHYITYFDSGVAGLDSWLDREALPAHRGGLSRTHVSVDPADEDRVVKGYFTLAPTVVTEQIPGSTGSREDGYPSYLLCKLARDQSMARTGHGSELLAEAVVKTVEAADAAGGRFLVVDPHFRDLTPSAAEKLRAFYREFGFVDLEETNRMYATIKTLRVSLNRG
jgi:GNAT superfamily N-acetyltransferase